MDVAAALQAYDRQLRRSLEPPAPGWTVEAVDQPAPLIRLVSPPGTGWGDSIVWTDLDERSADTAIADTIAFFSGLGRGFEWKHHGYDHPPDLPDRLRAAGLEPEAAEALVIGEAAEVRRRLAESCRTGVTVRPIRGSTTERQADWAAIDALKAAVWGRDSGAQTAALAAEHGADPEAMSVWLAEGPDGRMVSAAWVRFHAGTDFASLWGGATLPAWRRRGIYTELVARRADEAAERGFRYLQVDASPDSRPILERLGLHMVTTTTPWLWSPSLPGAQAPGGGAAPR